MFGVLLIGATVVNLAGGWQPYWTVAGITGLVVVTALERRAQRLSGPRGRVWAALVFSAGLLLAVRLTAEITGSIVAADTVLGVVLFVEGVLLRSRALMIGGAACAVLALASSLLVPVGAIEVVVSLTSALSLLAAAWLQAREGSAARATTG